MMMSEKVLCIINDVPMAEISVADLESLCAKIEELEKTKEAYWRKNAELGLKIIDLTRQLEEAKAWINDLQSGMYINCVYCGFRYGPKDKVPSTMSDALKDHIEICPKHPMSHLKSEIKRLREGLERVRGEISEDVTGNYEVALKIIRELLTPSQGKEA